MTKTWYDCGWNDTVYGLQTCRSGEQTIKYIYDMREAACSASTEYARGAMECIDFALANRCIPLRREGN